MAKTYLELDNHKIEFYEKRDFFKIEFHGKLEIKFQNKDTMLNSFKTGTIYRIFLKIRVKAHFPYLI